MIATPRLTRHRQLARIAVRLAVAACLGSVIAAQTIIDDLRPPPKADPYEGFSLAPGNAHGFDWNTTTPKVRLPFSIARADEAGFEKLEASRISASIDRKKIEVVDSDLDTRPVAHGTRIVLVIDASRSMIIVPGLESVLPSVPKLGAAKDALLDFIEKLDARDEVAIVAFDETQRVLLDMTADKAAAADTVRNFTIGSAGYYTELYSGLDFAIQRAVELGAKHVVFVTDGVEDTRRFRGLDDVQKDEYKKARESQAADKATPNNIRVHTIAIGDRQAIPGTLAYVDADSMQRIAEGTGGRAHYVDLPQLASTAQDPVAYKAALVAALAQTLNDIRQVFRYDHTLTLRLKPDSVPPDGIAHHFRIVFAAERTNPHGTVQLPIEFSITLPKRPDVLVIPDIPTKAGPGQFIPTVIPATVKHTDPHNPGQQPGPTPVTTGEITLTYLTLAAGLGAAALVPPLFGLIAVQRRRRVAHRAVVVLKANDPRIGGSCPNERDRLGRDFLFKKGDALTVCPECGTAHHLGCWHLNKDRCWNVNCRKHVAMSPGVLDAHNVEA